MCLVLLLFNYYFLHHHPSLLDSAKNFFWKCLLYLLYLWFFFLSRLQYFARGSQTYHAQLTAALKGKNALELKDEQVRIIFQDNSYLQDIWCILSLSLDGTGSFFLSWQHILAAWALVGHMFEMCERVNDNWYDRGFSLSLSQCISIATALRYSFLQMAWINFIY